MGLDHAQLPNRWNGSVTGGNGMLRKRWMVGAATAVMLLVAPAALAADETNAVEAETSGGMVLPGGDDGAVFPSLTVVGEDRIRIEFDRPTLSLDLDPRDARGLEWGDPLAVLQRSGIDLVGPFLRGSAEAPLSGLADAWLDGFRTGPVARFRPALEDVAAWKLTIADSRSDTVAVFEGKGKPPEEIAWNGFSRDGSPAAPGLVYSYALDASDRAGNRRTFPGESFELPAYRVEEGAHPMFLLAGRSLGDDWIDRPGKVPPSLLREVASRLNQASERSVPIDVRVRARSFEEADRLAGAIVDVLRRSVLGDPARIRPVTEVRPDAPDGATVTIGAMS